MLKKFWIPVILCVIVILAGCDEGKQMMKPVLTPEPVSEPTTEQPPPDDPIEYPEITYENALNLIPGQRYSVQPTHVGMSPSEEDPLIQSLNFGSVKWTGDLFPNLSTDVPKVLLYINLKPQPYAFSVDGVAVIGQVGIDIYDKIVIEITQKEWDTEQEGGSRATGRFTYQIASYKAVAIENLTNPDRKFEYE